MEVMLKAREDGGRIYYGKRSDENFYRVFVEFLPHQAHILFTVHPPLRRVGSEAVGDDDVALEAKRVTQLLRAEKPIHELLAALQDVRLGSEARDALRAVERALTQDPR